MKHRRALLLAAVAGLLWPTLHDVRAASATNASAGTITGKVTGLRDASSVLVYLATVPGVYAPRAAAQIKQRSLMFEPRVLPVVVGATVNFLNEDDVQHNVFTPSAAGDLFNLGTWPKGQIRSQTFSKLGRVDLLCNVHHEMKAYVLVLQNPFFALTDGAGSYRIENVPPGSYQLKVWHEKAGAAPQPVRVSSGVVTAHFDLVAR
jgi:plastocyanin